MDAKWKAWLNKSNTIKQNEHIKKTEAEQAEIDKRKQEIEAAEASIKATEEENKRIAAACKAKCTAAAVKKAMGDIRTASSQVSEFCGKNFPCGGEIDKVAAEANAI